MTNRLPLVLSIASALTLACVTVYQGGLISDLNEHVTRLISRLKSTEVQLQEEMIKNEQLLAEVQTWKDSVAVLHVHISTLEDKISSLKATVVGLNKTIEKQVARIADLTNEINRLSAKNNGNEQRIRALEEERMSILEEMEKKDRERAEAVAKAREAEQLQLQKQKEQQEANQKLWQQEQKLDETTPAKTQASEEKPVKENTPATAPTQVDADKVIKTQQQQRRHNIRYNTAVAFSKVTVRSKEDGKDLKKVKGEGWKYVLLDFNFENKDADALMDEEFLVQIFDLDNQVVVPYNERNPSFPGSEQGAAGFRFKYEGKPVFVRYFNSQQKEADNFEVRLFYVKDEFVIPLQNGVKQIVKNGTVVTS